MKCLFRRDYVAAELMHAHPPILDDKNKQLVHQLAMAGPTPGGSITVTRWGFERLATELAPTEVVPLPGYYDYAGAAAGVWHVNFADPTLFVAYGSRLLAQDELQCCEHPALGSIREALRAEQLVARTEEGGLYGNRFGVADAKTVREAVRLHRPPATSNLIAIAAPVGRGEYTRPQIDRVVATAWTGFAAAVAESARLWPGAPCEVRTGFWGCGAFGGNRELMTMLQLLAARLAGVTRVTFYAFDDAGRADFEAGARALDTVLAGSVPELATLLERIADLDYAWGVGNGT
jgi:hypothetical protein